MIAVAKCLKCKKEAAKPTRNWEYGHFMVEAYVCSNCNTKFREYTLNGKHNFTLRIQKGKGYIKA